MDFPSGRFFFDFFTPSPSNPGEFLFPPLAPAIHALQFIAVVELSRQGTAHNEPAFLADEKRRQIEAFRQQIGLNDGLGTRALKIISPQPLSPIDLPTVPLTPAQLDKLDPPGAHPRSKLDIVRPIPSDAPPGSSEPIVDMPPMMFRDDPPSA